MTVSINSRVFKTSESPTADVFQHISTCLVTVIKSFRSEATQGHGLSKQAGSLRENSQSQTSVLCETYFLEAAAALPELTNDEDVFVSNRLIYSEVLLLVMKTFFHQFGSRGEP